MKRNGSTVLTVLLVVMVGWFVGLMIGQPGGKKFVAFVKDYRLPDATPLSEAVRAKTPGCTNVSWHLGDAVVVAVAYTPSTNIQYVFHGGRDNAVFFNRENEDVFPELIPTSRKKSEPRN